MKVTADNLPNIYAAFRAIDDDSGMDPREEFDVPEKWDSSLDEIEAALGELTEEERETLAIGEETEMHEIAERTEVLGKANILFAEFFTDWSPTENGGTTS